MGNKPTSAQQTWDWDVRVRERNLKAGLLTEKEVEKFLTGLEDLDDRTDTVTLAQPALSSSGRADVGAADDDDDDDEDDAEDGDGEAS